MAGITLAQAQAQLDAWLAVSLEIAEEGQAVEVDGNTYTKANAAWIQKQITFWDAQVKRLTRGGIRVRGATPVG